MFRTTIYYKNYYLDFIKAQPIKIQKKIAQIIRFVQMIERPSEVYLKHLTGTDGLFEIRIQFASNIYRVFCCFDEGKLVVLLNGFQKKTNKTPPQEIERAERLKKEYFEIWSGWK